MTVTRIPLDFDTLEKGRVFGVEEIEEIVGLPRDDEKFPLKRLSLCARIEREMRDRGRPMAVRLERGALKVMDDPENAEYQPKEYDRHLRGAARALGRLAIVEPEKLDEGQRNEHEHQMLRMSRITAAIKLEKRKLATAARRRLAAAAGDTEP